MAGIAFTKCVGGIFRAMERKEGVFITLTFCIGWEFGRWRTLVVRPFLFFCWLSIEFAFWSRWALLDNAENVCVFIFRFIFLYSHIYYSHITLIHYISIIIILVSKTLLSIFNNSIAFLKINFSFSNVKTINVNLYFI